MARLPRGGRLSLDKLPALAAREVPLATAAQMAEVDRNAERSGVSLADLMENAARQIATVALTMLDDPESAVVAAVVGSGNNGGDALGALRHLAQRDVIVDAYLSGPADRLRPLARDQYARLLAMNVPLYDASTQREGFVGHRLEARTLIIDGLLGYSATGAPRGTVATLIEAINSCRKPVLAVDIPSGLDPDDGSAPGAVVRATTTVTLGLPKTGLLWEGARELVGELVLADIGIPADAYDAIGISAPDLFARGGLLRIIR